MALKCMQKAQIVSCHQERNIMNEKVGLQPASLFLQNTYGGIILRPLCHSCLC